MFEPLLTEPPEAATRQGVGSHRLDIDAERRHCNSPLHLQTAAFSPEIPLDLKYHSEQDGLLRCYTASCPVSGSTRNESLGDPS